MTFADFVFQQLRNRLFNDSQGEKDHVLDSGRLRRRELLLLHKLPLEKSRFSQAILAAPLPDEPSLFAGKARFTVDGDTEMSSGTRPEAALWYGKAAEQGFAQSQHNLAVLHERGKGVEKDLALAFDLYSRAAQQGNPASQYNLAAF